MEMAHKMMVWYETKMQMLDNYLITNDRSKNFFSGFKHLIK